MDVLLCQHMDVALTALMGCCFLPWRIALCHEQILTLGGTYYMNLMNIYANTGAFLDYIQHELTYTYTSMGSARFI